jgi:hypothetical protein
MKATNRRYPLAFLIVMPGSSPSPQSARKRRTPRRR